jgi:hypothetical protein
MVWFHPLELSSWIIVLPFRSQSIRAEHHCWWVRQFGPSANAIIHLWIAGTLDTTATIVFLSSVVGKISSPRTGIADFVRMAYQLVRWARTEPCKRSKMYYSRIGPWTGQSMVLGLVHPKYGVSLESTHCWLVQKLDWWTGICWQCNMGRHHTCRGINWHLRHPKVSVFQAVPSVTLMSVFSVTMTKSVSSFLKHSVI